MLLCGTISICGAIYIAGWRSDLISNRLIVTSFKALWLASAGY